MALSYLGRDYPSLKEHIRSTGVRTHGESPPSYAHPIDGWITGALEATPVKALLQKPVDTLVSLPHGNKLISGVSVDQKSFPEISQMLSHCSRTLGIPVPHAVVQHDPSIFNAYTAGTDEYAFISIS